MSEKTKQEPGAVRTKKVEIELPEGLYDLLEKVSKVQDRSAEECIIEGMVMYLDMELETDLGYFIGETSSNGPGGKYRGYIESLAWPEKAAMKEAAV